MSIRAWFITSTHTQRAAVINCISRALCKCIRCYYISLYTRLGRGRAAAPQYWRSIPFVYLSSNSAITRTHAHHIDSRVPTRIELHMQLLGGFTYIYIYYTCKFVSTRKNAQPSCAACAAHSHRSIDFAFARLKGAKRPWRKSFEFGALYGVCLCVRIHATREWWITHTHTARKTLYVCQICALIVKRTQVFMRGMCVMEAVKMRVRHTHIILAIAYIWYSQEDEIGYDFKCNQ